MILWEKWCREAAERAGITIEELKKRLASGEYVLQITIPGVERGVMQEQVIKTFSVTCPCCKGETRLIVFDELLGCDIPMTCCHCIGGRVAAEVEDSRPYYDPSPPNDFNTGPILKRHAYWPDYMHMGDCAVCGHIRESPVHSV